MSTLADVLGSWHLSIEITLKLVFLLKVITVGHKSFTVWRPGAALGGGDEDLRRFHTKWVTSCGPSFAALDVRLGCGGLLTAGLSSYIGQRTDSASAVPPALPGYWPR